VIRVGIYARFSSELQESRSIDDQVALCRSYAERQGWAVVAVYADHAVSGTSVHGRPEYARLRVDAERSRFEIILAEDLDRFSRNQADAARLYEEMTFREIGVYTVADGRCSELHFGLKGTMNALYVRNLALKVRRGQAGMVDQGKIAGGRSYGYRPIPGRPGEVTVDDAEARWSGASSGPTLLVMGLAQSRFS
jgi:site-specific DNA recombinase